ncbi:DUF2642 domain-containing protein [Geomicrobium sp. JCM 19039]|uniref:DUF2642 domain-containing protein n=1 Tax=Geomicrobium sp. JCM 19039 TaxID=1460636 RepID=UPI00045F43D4|nr:DUF2642 domain-containing protein [Geomicrobium sp. JCM 19039]GAK12656.1 hypothetical protein JCM19039_2448 [Geomicrobium sp. JCM 19039]
MTINVNNINSTSLYQLLASLINENVQITTQFGIVIGAVLEVNSDYVVIQETDGALAFVRFTKIEVITDVIE